MYPWKELFIEIEKIEKKDGSSLKKPASHTEIIKDTGACHYSKNVERLSTKYG